MEKKMLFFMMILNDVLKNKWNRTNLIQLFTQNNSIYTIIQLVK